MRIGVAGPFDPSGIPEYFPEGKAPHINPTASSVTAYVSGLLKTGNTVTVITSDPFGKDTVTIEGKGIKLIVLPGRFRIRGFGRYRMHRRIRDCIEKELGSMDVLHAQWTYEYALAAKAFVDRLPVYCSVRDWCPYLMTIAKGVKNAYYWRMSHAMFKKVMGEKKIGFIANSEYTRGEILGAYPENEVTLIPNPILERFIITNREKRPDSPVFVSISQSLTNVRKNYHTLLKAFSLLLKERPDARLKLIGSYTEEWKASMEAEGLMKNTELLGSLSHDEVFGVLDGATCLVHPSLEETFGNILLEAMARRVVCIGGKSSGAVPQVLGEGRFGLLCDVTDPVSIAEAMRASLDAELAEGLVESASKRLTDNFTETKVAERHLRLFLSGKRSIKDNE